MMHIIVVVVVVIVIDTVALWLLLMPHCDDCYLLLLLLVIILLLLLLLHCCCCCCLLRWVHCRCLRFVVTVYVTIDLPVVVHVISPVNCLCSPRYNLLIVPLIVTLIVRYSFRLRVDYRYDVAFPLLRCRLRYAGAHTGVPHEHEFCWWLFTFTVFTLELRCARCCCYYIVTWVLRWVRTLFTLITFVGAVVPVGGVTLLFCCWLLFVVLFDYYLLLLLPLLLLI